MKTRITVHATMTHDQCLTVRDIEKRDRDAGFTSCGYHYVIRRSGAIDIGRTSSQPSLHDGGHGRETVAILLIGGADKKGQPKFDFTEQQIDSLRGLVADLMSGHDITLDGVSSAAAAIPAETLLSLL